MTMRTVLIVLLALVLGGTVVFGVNSALKQRKEAVPVDTVPVVVVSEDVARFTTLTEDMLSIRQYPKDLVPPGSVRSVSDAVERVTLASLAKGDALSRYKISTKGAGRGMGAVIPKGMRAFTISTPTVASSVAGFILPGSKVDVLLTIKNFRSEDRTGGTSTTTLLQNLEVLAVDQRVEAPMSNKVDQKELRSVTLLVTPDQAAKLDLGQNAGTLHLSLRNSEDTTEAKTKPATLADLRFLQEPPKSVAANGEKEPPKTKEKDNPIIPVVATESRPKPPALIRTIRGVDNNLVELR